MNPRELLLAALRRQPTGRVPCDLIFTGGARARFIRETGISDPDGFLNLDYRYVYPLLPARLPDFTPYFKGRVPDWPEGDWDRAPLVEFGARQLYPPFFRLGPRTCINEWGEYRIFDEELSYHTKIFPLPGEECSLAEVAAYPFPDLSDPQRCAGAAEQVQAVHARGYAAVLFLEMTVFEKTWRIRGFENFFADMLQQTETAERLLDEVARRTGALAAGFAAAGVDIIQFGDDVGAEDRMLMRPAVWRKFLKPHLAQVIARAKAANPGLLAFYHSDGHIDEIIPELIEIGVDVLNPVQPEAVDIPRLKREYGDRLSFWGGIGVQTTLPFGTPQDVRQAVRSLIEQAGEGGGLVVSPSHVIEPDVPSANILAMIDAVREFGGSK